MTKKGKLFTKNGEEWIEIGGNSEISQDANGITIGETALQDASTSQDGLMTKEQVTALNGKADSSEIPDTSGLATKQELTDGLAGKQDSGDYALKSEIPSIANLATKSAVQTAQSKADSAYNLADGKLDAGANAVSATKATNDGSNRNIVNTYATKTEAQTAQNKADSAYNLANGKLGKSENAVSATKATNDGQNRNIASTYALKTDITSVYRVMGSCTTAQLASKAKNKGDVWNLTDAGSYGGAGTNVVYTGTEWDALGGTIDLSGYALKTEIPDISGLATKGEVQTAQSKANSAYNLADGKLDKNGKANSAGTADNATNDSQGRNIVNTYLTKAEAPNTSDFATKSEVQTAQNKANSAYNIGNKKFDSICLTFDSGSGGSGSTPFLFEMYDASGVLIDSFKTKYGYQLDEDMTTILSKIANIPVGGYLKLPRFLGIYSFTPNGNYSLFVETIWQRTSIKIPIPSEYEFNSKPGTYFNKISGTILNHKDNSGKSVYVAMPDMTLVLYDDCFKIFGVVTGPYNKGMD